MRFWQWIDMGGYAAYVWPAYGLVTLVFLALIVSAKWQKTRTHNLLRRWFNIQ